MHLLLISHQLSKLTVTGAGSVGECAILSQLSWLLVHTTI